MIRVLYYAGFSNAPDAINGGTLYARENIIRLSKLDNIELSVCTSGAPMQDGIDDKRFKDLNVFHRHIITEDDHSAVPFDNSWNPSERWPFSHESSVRPQLHVDEEFLKIVAEVNPDIVVVVYLFSTMWVPTIFSKNIPVMVLTVNNEGDFFHDLRITGNVVATASKSRIAELRLRRFEKLVFECSDMVVGLSKGDWHLESATLKSSSPFRPC